MFNDVVSDVFYVGSPGLTATMTAFWGIVPSENTVIICSVVITYLGIILRAPDVLLNPEVFLPELIV